VGTITNAMRNGQIKYHLMNAFFFEVLVRAECGYSLFDKSDLHFYLTFEEKTSFNNPSEYLPKDLPVGVLNEIIALSIDADFDKKYQVQRAVKTNGMTIVRPRPSNPEQFKVEMLRTLEDLEKIFKKSVSQYGHVMQLSFSYGLSI